jgi:hypothetical protein
MKTTLDVWPELPLLIQGYVLDSTVDRVSAITLKHSDRVCQINFECRTLCRIEEHWAVMQMPFPELTGLRLSCVDDSNTCCSSCVPVLPDSFLGGSAPRLRYFCLNAIPFPGLPKLLFSATHLVHLHLLRIPHSGYISPEAMAACLSILTNLESLCIQFESPQSSPDQGSRCPPPPTRSILPALEIFSFQGAREYLEELVARVDAPQLCQLLATFLDDVDFDTPELVQFISRTPTFGAYDEARLVFCCREFRVRLRSHPKPHDLDSKTIKVGIIYKVPDDQQLPSVAQICTSSLCPLLTMENLYIDRSRYSGPFGQDDIDNTEWLDLLFPFSAVKNLFLSNQFLPRIALALQELTGGRTTEVLPALQNVLLEGFDPSEPVQEGIARFVSARQLANHPVAISVWDRRRYEYDW